MNEREILEKIIAQEGSCTGWASRDICTSCPMSRLKKKIDGTFYSCIEAIGADAVDTEKEQDDLYKDAASRLLFDMSIEEMLKV